MFVRPTLIALFAAAITSVPVAAFAAAQSDVTPAQTEAPAEQPAATPKKVKPPKGGKVPKTIVIENGRKVSLLSFEIVHPPSDKPAKTPPKPVLKLTQPIPAGEKATLKLNGAKGCAYIARWSFEDASDEGPLDLCHDPKIVLTD